MNFHHIHQLLEAIMPLAILFYTHFLDERVHEQLRHNHAYHYGKTRWLFRYQWEICLLIISMLFILGAKMWIDQLEPWGEIILSCSILLIIFLAMLTIRILDNTQTERKLNAAPFYLSILCYFQYIGLVSIFYILPPNYSITIADNEYSSATILIGLFLISIITVLILRNWINRMLFHPVVLDSDTLKQLVRVSKHPEATVAMRGEALRRILDKAKPGSKFWHYANDKLRALRSKNIAT
jgi:cytochrome bd-type quinol oxidase subunit 2